MNKHTIFWIIISVAVYILSAFLYWLYVKIAHSSGGVNENDEVDPDNLWYTFLPVINTLNCLDWLFLYPKRKSERTRNINKFFNVKHK